MTATDPRGAVDPVPVFDADQEAHFLEIRTISDMAFNNRPDSEIALAVDRSRDFIIAYVKKWDLPSGRERLRARRAEKRARAAITPTTEKAPAVEVPPTVEAPAFHDVMVAAEPANDVTPIVVNVPRLQARPGVKVRPSLAPAREEGPAALKCRCGRLATRGGVACRQCTPSSRARDGWKAAGREFAMPPSRTARLAREAEASKSARDAERARLLRELSPERIVRIAAPAYDTVALVSTNDVIDNVNEIGSMNSHNDEM